VRELENAIEHAFVVCGTNTIEADDLPPHIIGQAGATPAPSAAPGAPLEEAEKQAIRDALERHGGHRGLAAADLGVSRNTLWRKMKRHGLSS
jgi:two-component system NtrC family response regulator